LKTRPNDNDTCIFVVGMELSIEEFTVHLPS
jgi:hypothetical protein